jgi:Tol biopolymer transport system component
MRSTIVAAFTLLALIAAPAAHERVSSGTKIFFESYRDGDFEIYAIDPETRATAKLTNNDFEDSSPTPSPDGSKVAFYSADGTSVVNADGSGRAVLNRCIGYNLSWSPDSSKIVCESSVGFTIVKADGTGARTVALPDNLFASAPSWSPDGTTIAFVSSDGVYVISPTGTGLHRVSGARADTLSIPVWAPDSTKIAFVADTDRTLTSNLDVVGADGSGAAVLAGNAETYTPAWAPDGTAIAYTGYAPKNVLEVFLVAPDGTGRRQLTKSAHGESSQQPSWSTDPTRVAYQRDRYPHTGDSDIFVIGRDGTGRRIVTEPLPADASNSSAAWAPGAVENPEPAPVLNWLRLSTKHQLSGNPILAAVIADGMRAALARQAECARIVEWIPGGKKGRSLNPCGDNAQFLQEIAVAGPRIAYVSSYESHTEYGQTLTVSEPRRKSVDLLFALADPEDGSGDYVGNIYGRGSLLVFNFWHQRAGGAVTKGTLWHVIPKGSRGARRCPTSRGDLAPGTSAKRCVRLPAADGMAALSVAGGKIVAWRAGGTIAVLRASGSVQRKLRIPGVLGARVQGTRLVALTADSLLVYDLRNGRKTSTWPIPPSADLPDPTLLDGYGNFVLYRQGVVHLVRLSDGRDRALQAPGQGPPVYAQLGPKGLFYEYNELYTRRPGRVLFVPLEQLSRAAKAG